MVKPNIKLAMERSMNDWMKTIGKQKFRRNKASSYAYLKFSPMNYINDHSLLQADNLRGIDPYSRKLLEPLMITISCTTAASKVIPNPGLSLTSMDEILQKRTDYEYLIDFVGVLCGLKRKTDVECNGKILKVIILEVFADGKKIPCNLVGDYFALIDINSLKKYQRPPVLILQSFKIKVNGDKVSLQNVINVSRVLINPDMQETVNFLNEYRIASHHFSRLRSNEIGDLVSVIDDESFDWKLIQTIANLKGNNEDGQFFMVGKIKEIVEDPKWWVFSCVFGHPIIGDDNVFHCQLCSKEVQHFMIRIKILVEDGTSCGMFVLLDSAATKLLGRTCSDVFLLLEDEMEDVSSDSAFSPILEDFSQYGQLRSNDNQVISGVPIQLHSIKEMLADILCAKIYSSASKNDQIYFLIGEIIDVLKHQKWWYYCCLCNAPVCHVGNVFYYYLCRIECVDAIRRYRIKIIVSHSNSSNIFILEDDEAENWAKNSPKIASSDFWYVQVAAKSHESVVHAFAWIVFLPGHASA
ncbi:Replication factor-A carboxy-terminal domain protein [Arachis hypogaea]|nr:Replication factor-A carboxy-terminal domain protein [Arachis hypogaea]